MKSIFVCLFLFLGVTGYSQTYDSLPNEPEHYKSRLALFRTQKTTAGKIVFLGNSITEGGNWRSLLKDSSVINRGISGDNTFGVLARLEEIVRHKPSKVFILIGVNDLSRQTPNSVVIENIFSIVGRIREGSPETQVFVQSILPVNSSHKKFPPAFSQQSNIEEINRQLKKYSEALRFIYVDLFSHFLNGRNQLDLKYSTDGLHLNQAGYQHWVAYLKKQNWV